MKDQIVTEAHVIFATKFNWCQNVQEFLLQCGYQKNSDIAIWQLFLLSTNHDVRCAWLRTKTTCHPWLIIEDKYREALTEEGTPPKTGVPPIAQSVTVANCTKTLRIGCPSGLLGWNATKLWTFHEFAHSTSHTYLQWYSSGSQSFTS